MGLCLARRRGSGLVERLWIENAGSSGGRGGSRGGDVVLKVVDRPGHVHLLQKVEVPGVVLARRNNGGGAVVVVAPEHVVLGGNPGQRLHGHAGRGGQGGGVGVGRGWRRGRSGGGGVGELHVLGIQSLVVLLVDVEGLLVEDDGRDGGSGGELHEVVVIVEGGAGGFGEGGDGRGEGRDAHQETLEREEHVLGGSLL